MISPIGTKYIFKVFLKHNISKCLKLKAILIRSRLLSLFIS
jgi:hypothetical protein